MKKPIVSLLTWTSKPTLTMMLAFMNMHNPVPMSLGEFDQENRKKLGARKWRKTQTDFLRMLAFNPHSSVLEFVNTVWVLKNVSRAFQQQLTRTRLAAYSIQSLRIVNPGEFADREDYHIPNSLGAKGERLFKKAMKATQEAYGEIISGGGKTEDARGVLPLNIFSPITMSINLRSLSNMLEVRLCNLAQGEFRSVALLMVDEISKKLGSGYMELFKKPCTKSGRCPMPINCGKTIYNLSSAYKGIDLNYWLKG